MRILVTGASGFLAHNVIQSKFCDSHELILLRHQNNISFDRAIIITVNLLNLNEVAKVFEHYSPDLVIHAAALASVEKCENERELAFTTNVISAANIAYACAKVQAKMVHISTDHLFDGIQDFYSEDDAIRPLNYYAYTKGLAETMVTSVCPTSLIVRTNFYGIGLKHHNSFAVNILNDLVRKKKVNLFGDVCFNPVLIDVVIEKIQKLLDKNAFGIYNISSNESISKYDFGVLLAKHYQLDGSLIKSISIDDKKDLVKRPKNMSLRNDKMVMKTGETMPSIFEQITNLNWSAWQ